MPPGTYAKNRLARSFIINNANINKEALFKSMSINKLLEMLANAEKPEPCKMSRTVRSYL